MQAKLAGALVAALLALIVGGCGSDTLSASKLRAQANTVCQGTVQRLRAVQREASASDEHAALARAATVLGDGVARLEALKPPPQLAARYRQFVSWLAVRRDATRSLSKPGMSRNELSPRELRAVKAHHSAIYALAKQLDFGSCL